MNRIDPKMKTSSSLSESIERAEEAVKNSIERFESAMGQLTGKVEGTSQKLHHVRDVAQESKDKLMQFKNEIQSTVDPLKPYLKQAKNYSLTAVNVVRAAPKPFLWLAIGVLGFAAFKYFEVGKRIPNIRKNRDDSKPDYSNAFPYQ